MDGERAEAHQVALAGQQRELDLRQQLEIIQAQVVFGADLVPGCVGDSSTRIVVDGLAPNRLTSTRRRSSTTFGRGFGAQSGSLAGDVAGGWRRRRGFRRDGERRREREDRDHQKESAAVWHSVLPVARRLCQCPCCCSGLYFTVLVVAVGRASARQPTCRESVTLVERPDRAAQACRQAPPPAPQDVAQAAVLDA